MIPSTPYDMDQDTNDAYDIPLDWLLDASLSTYQSTLRVRIQGTRLDNYLEGKYESLEVHVLAASPAASNFDQTALVKMDSTSEERTVLMKYLVPVTPSMQDEAAVVLTGPRKGEKVKIRQRPDASSLLELVVVESEKEYGGAFWECQKDWMCAVW